MAILFGNNILAGASGVTGETAADVGTYTGKSLIFDKDSSQMLSRSGGTATSTTTWTFSFWIKRASLGNQYLWSVGAVNDRGDMNINGDNQLQVMPYNSSGANATFTSTMRFLDTSAWYHIVVSADGLSSTASTGDMDSKMKAWVNGEQIAMTSSVYNTPTGGVKTLQNATYQIGQLSASGGNYFDGYMAGVSLVDGQALGPEAFGHRSPESGAWVMEEPPVAEMIASGGNTDAQISGTQFHNHIFTADGTLTVTQGGYVEYLVVGGGGGGGSRQNSTGGGGGAGGYRTGFLQVPKGSYSITVGAGGAISGTTGQGNDGAASVFHTITASGGGGGGFGASVGRPSQGLANGSGGGGGYDSAGGAGGDYGNNGGAGGSSGAGLAHSSGGGGGASAVGFAGSSTAGGPGGAGTASTITGSSVTYAGGGGGGGNAGTGANPGTGGAGGGGAAGTTGNGTAGTANTGGGGGGAGNAGLGNVGGSGIVIIRYFKPDSFSFGNLGFYLDFSDADSTTVTDNSPNSNAYTGTNYGSDLDASYTTDTPINNFCTLSAINSNTTVLGQLSNGAREILTGGGSGMSGDSIFSSFKIPPGKWYFEYKDTSVSTRDTGVGISGCNTIPFDSTTFSSGAVWYNTTLYFEGTQESYGTTFATNDIVGVAFDADTRKIWFSHNGTFTDSGDPAAGSNPKKTLAANINGFTPVIHTGNNGSGQVNFGQPSFTVSSGNADGNGHGNFEFAPPSGFLALCTANMPDVEIGQEADDLASDYFSSTLYTGNGSQTRTISGIGFQPDLVWQRIRAGTTQFIGAWDSVRGFAGNKTMDMGSTTAEGTWNGANAAEYGFVSGVGDGTVAFDDGTTATTGGYINTDTRTYVIWAWKSGSSTLGTGDFTQGTIASTCRRDLDAGFSIVSYTGTGSAGTIGHGLSKAPECIIFSNRDTGSAHTVYHEGMATSDPADIQVDFNGNGALYNDARYYNDTEPTVTVMSVNNYVDNNANTDKYIAYCWHSVDGFSKFGSYIGNNNADGPFVYCGFSPAYVITRRVDSGDHWRGIDSARHPVNDATNPGLKLNDQDLEADAGNRNIDFLSNGFKMRDTDVDSNASGGRYIFLAWAETPFKYGNAK